MASDRVPGSDRRRGARGRAVTRGCRHVSRVCCFISFHVLPFGAEVTLRGRAGRPCDLAAVNVRLLRGCALLTFLRAEKAVRAQAHRVRAHAAVITQALSRPAANRPGHSVVPSPACWHKILYFDQCPYPAVQARSTDAAPARHGPSPTNARPLAALLINAPLLLCLTAGGAAASTRAHRASACRLANGPVF